MSNVFLPLGGSGGKNRGAVAVLGDDTPFTSKGSIVSLPLPAGNYKKSTTSPRSDYGDGKNSEVTISKELLKKMAIESFGIGSITNFSLSMYGHKQVQLTWKNPSVGLWSGARFVFKYGSLPESISDSFFIFDSDDVHFEKATPEERELFVRVFNYVTVNGDRWYDNGDVSAKINVTGISGSVTLSTGAGVWTVPEGVRKIRYILVGHGGAGYSQYNRCGGGGGGGYFNTGYMDVSPGQNLSWVVPTVQGQPTVLNGVVANSGESPSKNLIPVYYTKPYQYIDNPDSRCYAVGGSGGSGGGGGTYNYRDYCYSGSGGSNGSMGYGAAFKSRPFFPDLQLFRGGQGQGMSTLGFNGVLYSGGGGGSSFFMEAEGHPDKLYCFPKEQEPEYIGGYYRYGKHGLGGAGGGGAGYTYKSRVYSNGIDGLGGGGGGGYRQDGDENNPQIAGQGGTGCIYIAWGSLMNDGS